MSETKERTIVKKVQNAQLYSDGTIHIENVRLSYPHLDAPWAKKATDSQRYSATFLMPKATHRAAKDLIKNHNEALMAEKKIPFIKPDARCLRDGDQTGKKEYAGCFYVASGETNPPAIRTMKPGERLTAAQVKRTFYAGCYVNAVIRPWVQDNEHGKRVNAGLTAVQFARDGEPFGEGRIGDEEIDETFRYDAGSTGGYDEDEV